MTTVSVGCDHGGLGLKHKILEILHTLKVECIDQGTFTIEPCDYPDIAQKVCQDIQKEISNFGILVCRTGIGMCIAANKMKGIRAAVINNKEICTIARQHNDLNVMCLGADSEQPIHLECLINTLLQTPFDGGRHLKRVKKLEDMEPMQI